MPGPTPFVGQNGSVLIWIGGLVWVLAAILAISHYIISGDFRETQEHFAEIHRPDRRAEYISIFNGAVYSQDALSIYDRSNVGISEAKATYEPFITDYLHRLRINSFLGIAKEPICVRLGWLYREIFASEGNGISFQQSGALAEVFHFYGDRRSAKKGFFACKLGSLKDALIKDQRWNGYSRSSFRGHFGGSGRLLGGGNRFSQNRGLLLHVSRRSFHPLGLSMNITTSLPQQKSLPDHRSNLQHANDGQHSCKPLELPLYLQIPAALLTCFIAWCGFFLYVRRRKFYGSLLILCGLGLLFSVLTTIGFGDPLFWRAEWRALTFQHPDRCRDEYYQHNAYRQSIPHNARIVPQKPLD